MNLDDLNPPQREAVLHESGPLQILAGAGSGKTRVITRRLAALVERGVAPWRILAVTFTNKAAGEMRSRAEKLLGERAKKLWVGTFHSTCAKLLRIHAYEAGLRPDFNIYDDDDQKRLVKRVMKDVGVSEDALPVRAVLSRIDRAKNEGIGPGEFAAETYRDELVARVYPEYQARLRQANAVDFGDLLLDVLELCDHPEAGPAIVGRFEHVLVDEFQDTNRVQYRLVKRLAQAGNLCVVGDDDQSIYAWRGADVRNILDFERDHPGCRVVKLEQNYRSTEVILDAANGVIAKNLYRKPKRLFTEHAGGEPVIYYTAPDERKEAEFIVRAIGQLAADEGREPGDFAVLYRMHAQSRPLEEALRAHDLPYAVLGGLKFFDRAEVKDLLGYLRVVANPADEVSLERIVNSPPRGIGDQTLERVREHARAHGLGFFEAMRVAAGARPQRPPKGEPLFGVAEPVPPAPEAGILGEGPRKKLAAFVELIEGLRERRAGSLAALAEATLDGSGMLERLEAEGTPEARERMANLEELVGSIRDYEREAEEPSLTEYLERVSLLSPADGASKGTTLMTIHAAKGLEFPVVFLAGLEEGTFPLVAPDDPREKLEEERRLAYVAMTRARERLVLTNAAHRRLFRNQRPAVAPTPLLDPEDPFALRESRFVLDVPERCIARPVARRSERPRAGVRGARIEEREDGTFVEREAQGIEREAQGIEREAQGIEREAQGFERDEPRFERDEPRFERDAARGMKAAAGAGRAEPRVERDAEYEGRGAPFRVGQRVRHEKFGEGKVRAVSGAGAHVKLRILFPGEGEKTVLAQFVESVEGP